MAKVKITGHASGTGVLTVTAPNTSTDRTITLPDSTGTLLDTTSGLDATKLSGTLPALNGASLTSVNAVNGGRKNIIINGSMKVSQRGTSFTDPVSGDYTLDRWRAGLHTNAANGNYTQEADAPTAAEAGTNFVKCLRIACTTIDTSTAATVRYYTRYHVEGQDIAHAGFGQAGVRYMTLSFWHKHTKAGTHSFGVVSPSNDKNYVAEYTQTSSDTWEKATHTFAVATDGTWATDTGNGLTLYFATHIGSNYQGTANTWTSGQGYGTANQVNNFDSTSNSMRFTGVQLEMGSVATDFEHRSYGEELALCLRYYIPYRNRAIMIASSSTTMSTAFNHIVPLRANPTFTISDTSMTVNQSGTGDVSASTLALNGIVLNIAESAYLDFGGFASSLTTGRMLGCPSSQGEWCNFDAEL